MLVQLEIKFKFRLRLRLSLAWRLEIILTWFSFVFYSYFPHWCIFFYLSDVTTEAVSTAASHHEGVNVTFSICIISPASQTHCVTRVTVIVLHPASYKTA